MEYLSEKNTLTLTVEIPIKNYKTLERMCGLLDRSVTEWLEDDIIGIIDAYESSN